MPRYIDADELLDKVKKAFNFEDRRGQLAYAVGCIETAPTADVEPVRHGYWRRIRLYKDDNGCLLSDYECTNCHKEKKEIPYSELAWEFELDNFCSHCGARMNNTGGE